MKTMGAFAAKTHFSELIGEVEKGEEVVITKHGRPVAKLVSMATKNHSQTLKAIERLKAFCQQNQLAGLDWKSLRDEGRR